MGKCVRIFGCLVVGVLLLLAACSVYAEEPVEQEATHDWSGVYLGIHAGYGWGDADTRIEPLPDPVSFANLASQTVDYNADGVIGGGQVGCNWQKKFFVVGVEADFSGSGMEETKIVKPIIQNGGIPYDSSSANISLHQDTDWFGTFRLRVGFAPIPKLLIYGTGGMAYGRVNYSADTDYRPNPPGADVHYPVSFSETKVGWTAGAGIEFAITSKWSVKGEYLYYNLGEESAVANAVPWRDFQVSYKWDTAAHTANIGLNYKF